MSKSSVPQVVFFSMGCVLCSSPGSRCCGYGVSYNGHYQYIGAYNSNFVIDGIQICLLSEPRGFSLFRGLCQCCRGCTTFPISSCLFVTDALGRNVGGLHKGISVMGH